VTIPKWVAIVPLALLCLWLGLDVKSCRTQKQAGAAVVQADQQHQAAVADASKGAVYDTQAETQAVTVSADAVTVAQLRAEVARLRQAVPRAPQPPSVPGLPAPEPVGVPVDLAPLVAKQDELIQGLSKENADLKTLVVDLTHARNSYHAAYDNSTKEAALRQIALEAQVSAVKASRWQGRIEGFAVGVVSGYVAGKVF
jgi:hypothetical protein